MNITRTFFLIGFTFVILTITGLTFSSHTLEAFAVPGTGTLFGIDAGNRNLITINPSTGFSTIVDSTVCCGPSLAIDPNTGIMYASGKGTDGNLYSINPSTAASTVIGPLVNTVRNAPGLDFRSDGVFFATTNLSGPVLGGTHLGTINTNTGLLTVIGPLGVAYMGAISFAPDGKLYGATENKNIQQLGALYTINTETGLATLVAPLRDSLSNPHPSGFSSIQFGCDGTLYYGGAFLGDFGTIDVNTGVYTQINSATATRSLGGLAFQVACPSPCSPPVSGDWTVSSTCEMTGDATATGNVIVPNGVVLTIPNGVTLDINFATKNLTVQAEGGVLIKSGGTIKSTLMGQVIINEIMINPAMVSDASGEWFELYNPTSLPIDLDGWVIRDDFSDSHTITSSVIIPPNGFVVLGRNADFVTNGGVVVDYQYSNFALGNSGDELIIEDQGSEIDRVDYDLSFDTSGKSKELSVNHLSDVLNDILTNWCDAVSVFGDGDLGTPSSLNDCVLSP